jgi:hypothetical protein
MGRILRYSVLLAMAVSLLAAATGVQAQAGAYTKLQVLLPGESAAPGTGSGKLGTPTSQTVGVPFTVTVRACDDSWNTVTSITNSTSLASSDASASLPGTFSLSSGIASVQVTLNAAGSFTVTATDETDPTIPDGVSSAVSALLLQGFEFERISQKNQYAGQSMTTSITAVDPNGNPVTGYNGPVYLSEITSYGDGRIQPSMVTMSNGSWSGSVTMYRADETSINRGNVNMYAYLAADPSINGTSDPFTVHPGPFSRVQIVVPGQDPWPGSVTGLAGTPASQSATQPFAVDVYATDAYWNPVPSADAVRITSSDNAANTPVNGTLSNGYAQLSVSLGTVGSQTLSVTDQTNGSIQGTTSPPIQVIASAPDHFEISTITSPITAGQSVAVTIRATDAGGNTITDYSGNGVLQANTGPGSISPEAITFTNGQWSGNITFRGAGGAVSFSCSDYSSPPHVGTSNSFVVDPAAFAGLQVLLPGQTPAGGTSAGFTGSPDDQNAGSSFTLTVRAVDQYWNRVSGINDNIALTSTDLFADMPAETTLANGQLVMPVTLYRTGPQTITASDVDSTSVSPHTSEPVVILPGTYSRIVIIAPGEEVAPGTAEGRTGSPTDQSINFAFTVSVYATDEWFNPVGGVSDVVSITSNDPLAELPPDAAMVDGVAQMSVRLSTGGYQQITATNVSQPAMPTSTTQVRAISSGFHLEAEVSPTTVQAGEAFTLTVKVTNDAGSVIQEINSAVTVEVQNASTQEPGRGTLLNAQFQLLQGQRTMSETYTFNEEIVLIVRDDAGNTPAVTEPITVLPGPPAEVKLSKDPSWVGGNRHATITARVVDQYDNGVPDQEVVFSLLAGNGTLTGLDSLTTPAGDARADYHSPRYQEIATIQAVSNLLSAQIDLETAFVNPNETGGYVTNYPNPFHPGEAPTTIAYKLDDNATVTIRIFTLLGGLVREERFDSGTSGGAAGLNEWDWDGRNGDGDVVASGGYIVRIVAQGSGETLHEMTRKVAVVR